MVKDFSRLSRTCVHALHQALIQAGLEQILREFNANEHHFAHLGFASGPFRPHVAAHELVKYLQQVKEAADTSNELARRMVQAGNFNKLLVVKISEDFEFDARLIDRKLLRKGKGKHAKLRWGEHQDPAAKDTAP